METAVEILSWVVKAGIISVGAFLLFKSQKKRESQER